ncbi:uncharacterized protein LOC133197843 [Saccostrea echinata]|uniref:uncharacterized protein LOC133197843 n=1 Tax=Saccostrea echinata TaxID=191078 RepID=UPI002A7FD9C9|nr:uncharacterized protein LOC133197843 [Saccostrea echinata]
MASPAKKFKSDTGPLPITIYVVEDVLQRKYSNGGVYGTTYATTSANDFRSITALISHEKHLPLLQCGKTYIALKYMSLQDGSIKLGQQTVLMHTKRPAELKEDVVKEFCEPPVIEELGRISSFNIKLRVSVKGEVTKVTDTIHTNGTKRKIMTLSDGNATIEVKLWGDLVDTQVFEGSTVVVTCVHVDVYQEKRSLNSSGSTTVKIADSEEEFSGTVNGVSFEESNSSILLDDEFLACSSEQLREIFPGGNFVENLKVKGRKRRSVIMSIEMEAESTGCNATEAEPTVHSGDAEPSVHTSGVDAKPSTCSGVNTEPDLCSGRSLLEELEAILN